MFTYDPTTTIGLVRLRLSDTDEATALFSDAEISAFLDAEGADWRKAAALALETTASNQALVLKVITRDGLQTDGAKLAAELRAQATALRAQAAASVATTEATAGALSVIPVRYTPTSTLDEFGRVDCWRS